MKEYKLERDAYKQLSVTSEKVIQNLGDRGDRVLQVSTSKSSKGDISSLASVHIKKVERGFISREHTMFEDYSKWFNRTPCARVTEKALVTAHEKALEQWPEIETEVKAKYGITE